MITSSAASPGIPGPRPLPVLNWVGNTVTFMREPVLYMRPQDRDFTKSEVRGTVRSMVDLN